MVVSVALVREGYFGPPAPPRPIGGHAPHPLGSSSGLTVDPARALLVGGGSVAFQAYFGLASDGCLPITSGVSWAIDGVGTLFARLNGSLGSSISLESYPYAVGIVGITATAIGLELCGGALVPYSASAGALVQIVGPLTPGGPTPSADPVLAGAPVTLSGTIAGGSAPFSVTVAFGDGTTDSFTLPGDGPFSVAHLYAVGTYRPSFSVLDALGEQADGPSQPTVVVSGRLSIAIGTPAGPAEVGRMYPMNASVLGGLGPYTLQWSDGLGAGPTGAAYTLDPTTAGPETVTATVTDAYGAVANASVTVLVHPRLSLDVGPVPGAGPSDLGAPVGVAIGLLGGCAPYSVAISTEPSGSRLDLAGVAAENLTEVLVPAVTGEVWAAVNVTDADGASTAVVAPIGEVVDAPALSLNLSTTATEAGAPVELVGAVAGGVPPISYMLASSSPFATTSAVTGPVGPAGLFSWTGTFGAAGPVRLDVRIEDATGASAWANVTLGVRAGLGATLEAALPNGTAGAPLPVEAIIAGGMPPYLVSLSASDGEYFAENLSAPGVLAWTLRPNATGPIELTLGVRDVDGATVEANRTVPVGPAPSTGDAPPATGTAPAAPHGEAPAPLPPLLGDFALGAGGGAGLGVVLLAGARLRGRSGRPAPTGAPPVPTTATLGTITAMLKEEGEMDRETIELRAEEDGIPPAEVSAALEEGVRTGRLSRREVPEGPPRYRWAAPEADRRPEETP